MIVVVMGLGALLAACVQATTGLGFALVLTPLLFVVTSSTAAIVIATALGLLLNLLVLFAEPRRPAVPWHDVLPILAAAIPGSLCGLLILQNVAKPVLQIAVGILVIGATVHRVQRRGRGRAAVASAPSAASLTSSVWRRLSLGLATGTLTTSTGVSGPPLALWLSTRSLSPGERRDSLSALFLGIGLIGAVTLVPVLGRVHVAVPAVAAAAAGVMLGHAIGRRIFARMTGAHFQQATLAIILAAGLASLVLGLTSV